MGGVDLLYWIFGIGCISITLNMILESMEKGNYKVMVNVAAFTLILYRVFGAVSSLLSMVETTFLRGL